jgi:purine-binding chemotaxis protein CheW
MAENSNAAQQEMQLVVFDLANEAYGVDIAGVQGIIRMQAITTVPKTPDFVEGVINLRGKVIPVVDLRKRFGMIATEETKDSRIVVVYIGGQEVGMVVDAVTEVLRIPADSIEPPSSVVTTGDADYIMGIAKLDDRLIILLELELVLSDAEKGTLAQVGDEEPAAAAA